MLLKLASVQDLKYHSQYRNIMSEIEKLEIYYYEHVCVAASTDSSPSPTHELLAHLANEYEYNEEPRRSSFYRQRENPDHKKENNKFHR